jgi:hypothetical protein
MPYNQYGDWVPDDSDVTYSPDDSNGINMTSWMTGDSSQQGKYPSDLDPTTLMPDRMGPLTKGRK